MNTTCGELEGEFSFLSPCPATVVLPVHALCDWGNSAASFFCYFLSYCNYWRKSERRQRTAPFPSRVLSCFWSHPKLFPPTPPFFDLEGGGGRKGTFCAMGNNMDLCCRSCGERGNDPDSDRTLSCLSGIPRFSLIWNGQTEMFCCVVVYFSPNDAFFPFLFGREKCIVVLAAGAFFFYFWRFRVGGRGLKIWFCETLIFWLFWRSLVYMVSGI